MISGESVTNMIGTSNNNISNIFSDESDIPIPLEVWIEFRFQKALKAKDHPERTPFYRDRYKFHGPLVDDETSPIRVSKH